MIVDTTDKISQKSCRQKKNAFRAISMHAHPLILSSRNIVIQKNEWKKNQIVKTSGTAM